MEYDIPDYTDYKITEDGDIVSYRTSKRKILKTRWVRQRIGNRMFETIGLYKPGSKNQSKLYLTRVIIAAKMGRWPESWVQARHKDGNPYNNSWNNIVPGDYLLNCIDEVENGNRKTSPEFLREAINRLELLLN